MVDEKDQKGLKDLISSLSGKILDEKNHGLKRFAYDIKKQKEGHLYEWLLEIDLAKVSELKKKIGFEGKVLRYLIIKQDVKNTKVKTKNGK